MKYLLLSVISFFLLSNCKKNETKLIVTKNNVQVEKLIQNPLDSIKSILKLPLGSKLIIDAKFPKIWQYPSLSSSKTDNYESDVYNMLLNQISNDCESSFSNFKPTSFKLTDFKQKKQIKIINYDNNILKKDNELDFKVIGKLKSFEKFEFIISHFRNFRKKTELLNLHTFDEKTGSLISGINIYSVMGGDMNTTLKLFYIDKDFNIYLNKFKVYDDSSSSDELIKYKVNNDGYFVKL